MNYKLIRKIMLFNTIVYFIVYFISCFVKWEFYNPYWWVLEIPNKMDLREMLIPICFMLLLLDGFIYFMLSDYYKQRNL